MDTSAKSTDSDVVMRFLTQGGATVELCRDQFTRRHGPTRSTNGYAWTCLGCGTVGSGLPYPVYDEYNYLPNEYGKARDDANSHATSCRSMPKP